MDRLDNLSTFVAVAEQGSFIAASRQLGRSTTAVSRAVAVLEDVLGTQLLTRTTRAVALTQAGQRTLEQARRILADYAQLRDAADGNATPSGLITITAPEMFGRLHVLPLVESFMAAHSNVEISLLLLNRMVSLIDEGVDLGVRIAHLSDSSLRAIRLGSVRQVLCASPDYLAMAGTPLHPKDLANHRVIAIMGARPLPFRWRFRSSTNPRSVLVKPQLVVNSVQAALEAASRGAGITRVLSYQSAPLEEIGALRRLLIAHEPPSIPIHLVYPVGRYLPSRIRMFIDHAVAALRGRFPEVE
ncbi:LysR family transcriptional regulator [Beijerinckia indica]|uniref:Transcriptional regulator, LysR family n=1 Tax=Beijerinckia indica subsp. indica (strain ATCC 9039 / DSM 1715 / NCIMB 8712) TaxID=395963 RepID=B2IE96_BEII9|nr:LysR family transcriptional regulator [Beijerinckia indica]ACB94116.1 transcriptional regulator, LysR family [Beijerinckia indica subsp. indica ATCC 9039]